MFRKTLFSGALAFTVLTAGPCYAEEVAPLTARTYAESVNSETAFAVGASGRELAYKLAGDREEGALRLFLSRESFAKREQDDILAEELNRISPAAGIRFVVDFSL